MHEIRERAERNERVLVTTLTKKMSEDLTDYLLELGIRVRYLHSEVDTLRRVELLRELRMGEFDVLVGINLLREGLDLPEVSLVSILDADKEGFLRSGTLADPDDRPRGPQRVRPGAHVRRHDHPVDGAGHRRDQPPPREADRLQHRARHRPARRCASGSATSPTCWPARPPTPRSCSAAASGRRVAAARSRAARSRAAASRRRRARAVAACRPASSASARTPSGGLDVAEMPRAQLADLIQQLNDQMLGAARELQFEVAARLRDEIGELKKELRGMDAAGVGQ